MNNQVMARLVRPLAATLIVFTVVGCAGQLSLPGPTSTPSSVSTAIPASPTAGPVTVEASPTSQPTAAGGALYQDTFTNPATRWAEDTFDNYFIGYHEPEYYHVEITSPHYKSTVFEPQKQTFSNATIELQVLTNSKKTAASGDFRYGLVFRRSGDQYYAFTISPRTKKWYVLKSSPNALSTLEEGTEESIHDLDADDLLRVDAQGPNLYFHINDRLVAELSDPDYAAGEVGFYVESFDSTSTHIHFDTLTIRDFERPEPQGLAVLYEDDFTSPASGWSEREFDNFFIGYHEPEYYHIEIKSPNYKTSVFMPEKRSFDDVTIEVETLISSTKTAAAGDFNYGLAFRRSGDQYYAFTISPRSKKWYVLKSSPNALSTLEEGTDDSLHDGDVADVLRVDAKGSTFLFHINGRLVSEVTDSEYPSGEIGFFVQSLDSPNTHIHFDRLTISDFQASIVCSVTAMSLNVRSGPGKSSPSFSFLTNGDTIQPLGISADKEWIKIQVDGSEDEGWIFNSEGFISCNAPVDLLPTVTP